MLSSSPTSQQPGGIVLGCRVTSRRVDTHVHFGQRVWVVSPPYRHLTRWGPTFSLALQGRWVGLPHFGTTLWVQHDRVLAFRADFGVCPIHWGKQAEAACCYWTSSRFSKWCGREQQEVTCPAQ